MQIRVLSRFAPLFIALAALSQLAAFEAPALAATRIWHVSADGDDGAPGTEDDPLRTVQRGLDVVQAGDTITVHAGTYREYVEFRRSGARGKPITLTGAAGERVVLQGTGLNWRYAVNLEGFDYLRVRNLTIRDYIRDGTRGFGVVGWGDTDDIELRNLAISGVETPIKFAASGEGLSTGITIIGIRADDYSGGGIDLGPGSVARVTIRNVRLKGPGEGNDTAVDGIAVEDGRDITVIGAVVSGHAGDGIDLKADGVFVSRSQVRGSGRDGLKLWRDARVENTLVFGTGQTALVLEGAGPFDIRNSQFGSGRGYGYSVTAGPYDGGERTTVSFWNTIFASLENGGTLIYVAQGTTVSGNNNLYWAPRRRTDVICDRGGGRCFSGDEINDGAWSAASGMDSASMFADPLFLNPNAGSYHLRPGSPAIDAGDGTKAPPTDLGGRRRPQGAAVDIGPYEQ